MQSPTSLPAALVAQRRAYAPSAELVVGRGVGWRCELDPAARGLYLYLGRSEVSHWAVPHGLRAFVPENLPGEDFFRIYLAADPQAFADAREARRAVSQAAASLRRLSPHNAYRGQGLRTWAEKQRPRRVVKKSQ